MYVFDLIDECENVLGSIFANSSIIESEDIREKVEQACQLLNKIRQSITTFDCNPSGVRGL